MFPLVPFPVIPFRFVVMFRFLDFFMPFELLRFFVFVLLLALVRATVDNPPSPIYDTQPSDTYAVRTVYTPRLPARACVSHLSLRSPSLVRCTDTYIACSLLSSLLSLGARLGVGLDRVRRSCGWAEQV